MASFGEGAFRLSLRKNIPLVFGWIEETKEKKLKLRLREIYKQTEKKPPSIFNPKIQSFSSSYFTKTSFIFGATVDFSGERTGFIN